MAAAHPDVIKKLPRQTMAQIAGKASRLGVTPEQYIRDLAEDDLAFEQRAQTTTLAELMGPGRDVDQTKLNEAVDGVRKRHHGKSRRKSKFSRNR